MNLKIVFWIFSLLFLFACNTDNSDLKTKIATLENELKESNTKQTLKTAQIADLEKKLQEATDPETVLELYKELIEIQRAKIEEIENTQSKLRGELKNTIDKASCESLVQQIQQLDKDIQEAIAKFQMNIVHQRQSFGKCTEIGYIGEQSGSSEQIPHGMGIIREDQE